MMPEHEKYQGYEINTVQVVGGGPRDRRDVTAERRRQLNGTSRWVIKERSLVLNRDGDWEYEPIPSSRDEEYKARTGWSTLNAAIMAFWRAEKASQ